MASMTLEEALAASIEEEEVIEPVNDILMINPETREIIVPESEKLFGVRQDDNAERKYFRCPRIVGDNIDLSEHHVFINYIPSTKDGTFDVSEEPGGYLCEDLAVDGNCVTFSWKLSGNVLHKAGYIAFAVYAQQAGTDGIMKTNWHTTIAVGKVCDTIPDGDIIIYNYPDIINQLLDRMTHAEEAVAPEAIASNVASCTGLKVINGCLNIEYSVG